jgi:hypothetical protein
MRFETSHFSRMRNMRSCIWAIKDFAHMIENLAHALPKILRMRSLEIAARLFAGKITYVWQKRLIVHVITFHCISGPLQYKVLLDVRSVKQIFIWMLFSISGLKYSRGSFFLSICKCEWFWFLFKCDSASNMQQSDTVYVYESARRTSYKQKESTKSYFFVCAELRLFICTHTVCKCTYVHI